MMGEAIKRMLGISPPPTPLPPQQIREASHRVANAAQGLMFQVHEIETRPDAMAAFLRSMRGDGPRQ